MARTTFSGPVVSGNGFIGGVEGPVQFPPYTVATAPSAAGLAGTTVYVSDGAAGDPVLAFSDGTDWLRCDTLAAISSS